MSNVPLAKQQPGNVEEQTWKILAILYKTYITVFQLGQVVPPIFTADVRLRKLLIPEDPIRDIVEQFPPFG